MLHNFLYFDGLLMDSSILSKEDNNSSMLLPIACNTISVALSRSCTSNGWGSSPSRKYFACGITCSEVSNKELSIVLKSQEAFWNSVCFIVCSTQFYYEIENEISMYATSLVLLAKDQTGYSTHPLSAAYMLLKHSNLILENQENNSNEKSLDI